MGKAKLTAMMIVRNESDRYLQEVLSSLSTYVDHIVVLDDMSTDNTADICSSFTKVELHQGKETQFFKDESYLRAQLWDYTIKTNPDWILAIDADEIFEKKMKYEIEGLLNQDEFEVIEFRLFDFWDGRTLYRIDGAWDPWVKKVRILFHYDPTQSYSWPQKRFHCGRIPIEVRNNFRVYQSDIRIKHYGWVRIEDRKEKYNKYKKVDDNPHLESVLAKKDNIKLEKWIPSKILPF